MNRFLITLTLTGALFLIGCQSPEPAPKAEEKAAEAPAAATPPPRKMTASLSSDMPATRRTC